MLPYIAEFLGTMMLIILGDGVVANVNLNKSGMKGAGAVQITLACGSGTGIYLRRSFRRVLQPGAHDRTGGRGKLRMVYGARICDRTAGRCICRRIDRLPALQGTV